MTPKLSFLVAILLPFPVLAESFGSAPNTQLHARDVHAEYRLPPLKDGPKDGLTTSVANAKVIARARALALTKAAPTDAWRAAESLYSDASASAARQFDSEVVTAKTASELNRTLAMTNAPAIRLAGPLIEVDEPIRIARDNLAVDLSGTELKKVGTMPYVVRIENARGIVISGGRFNTGDSAILIAKSEDVVARHHTMSGLTGNGIVVTGSKRVVVWGNHLTRLQRASILIHGDTAESVVARNELIDGVGSSNFHAGILVSDRDVADVAADPKSIFGPDGYWQVAEKMAQRMRPPRNNVIAFNRIASNRSSGIYLDGAMQTVIVSNLIEANSKEGMCLDNGATANVVAFNTIHQNGQRWGKTDDELAKDFVLGPGRLPDGTAASKVPAVSLDNAAYNILFGNAVTRNYGGGIKMVRTAYYNVLGMNTLLDNNEGASDRAHFFGIELGSAKADDPSDELDFKPSQGNIVFSNLIQGSHYAGIFFGGGSDYNDAFDNNIFGAKAWALESVSRQPNSSLNNLSNLPSRNISSGLDPNLIAIGAGRFD